MSDLRALLETEAVTAYGGRALYLPLYAFNLDFLEIWHNIPAYDLAECLHPPGTMQVCDDFAAFCAMPL